MTASTVALIGAMCHRYRELLPVLGEHLADNDGEVLPHLLMTDLIRWLVANRGKRQRCAEILMWLDDAFQGGDEDEKDLIVVSGVEMIPDPGEPGADLRTMLGPTLRGMDPWRADR